ncbi:polyprenyl synthetase family protein [Salidesulfovibrio brasiliensis]|uniref:polyprenyl synthetase family protein n=1 Tax=Salidesulfovibrio brasiliensis TaxID=221711 RepID=UPI0006D29C3D|nr:farnesyl diphosphate synthase [Salidesulfovibrio brasiliensis]
MSVKERLMERAGEVEAYLSQCMKDRSIPDPLLEAMEYSLLAGGKRLRPVLLLSWCSMLGGNAEAAMPFAASLECIHTYSLIHDDLPAMDDDDLRRGKPSSHKKFGEAEAILAGDGLLTEAFTLMTETSLLNGLPAQGVIRAMNVLSRAAGSGGMVGGQSVDMAFTGRSGQIPLDELQAMHAMKTGALITAACECGAILSGAGQTHENAARAYGRAIGVAFQIVDDVLDVVGDEATLGKPVGSDEGAGKSTYPALVGLERSMELARGHVDEAVSHLEAFHGADSAFLDELARYIVDRVN